MPRQRKRIYKDEYTNKTILWFVDASESRISKHNRDFMDVGWRELDSDWTLIYVPIR
jgi:hypothetical protein